MIWGCHYFWKYHYITNPINALSFPGNPSKMTNIHTFAVFNPPKVGNSMTPAGCRGCQVDEINSNFVFLFPAKKVDEHEKSGQTISCSETGVETDCPTKWCSDFHHLTQM